MALVLVLLATGCKPSQQAQAAPQDEDLGLQIQILNYTDEGLGVVYVNGVWAVSYTHLTLPTKEDECRSRWSPYH